MKRKIGFRYGEGERGEGVKNLSITKSDDLMWIKTSSHLLNNKIIYIPESMFKSAFKVLMQANMT